MEKGWQGVGVAITISPAPFLDSRPGWMDPNCFLGQPLFVSLPLFPFLLLVTWSPSRDIMPAWLCPDKPFRPYL